MKIEQIGEFGLIERISRIVSPGNRALDFNRRFSQDFIGIGDDAAVVKLSGRKCLLWTTDVLVENVHFLRSPSSVSTAFMLGWKSLAVSLSDIAAMGGMPKYALVSLGLRKNENTEFVEELYRGMKKIAQKFKVEIIGGDTTRSAATFINTAVCGEVEKKNLMLRSGAKPGDIICVTGTCGDSAAGLKLLKTVVRPPAGETGRSSTAVRKLIRKHLMPVPRVREAGLIAKSGMATSMIDNSDGLVSCVRFICGASAAGAVIYENKVPLSRELAGLARSRAEAVKKMCLSGGEDYELVFTVKKKFADSLKDRLMRKNVLITPIGEIKKKNEGLNIIRADGSRKTMREFGFEHF